MFYLQQVEQQGLILHQLGHGPPGFFLDCFDENRITVLFICVPIQQSL